jgi:carbon storage regulator
MLILARRPGGRVVIGEEILVTVMAVNGHTVRLGIEAPRRVSVYREEIWLAVKEENRAAAAATADALPSARAPTPHGRVPDVESPTTQGTIPLPKNRSHPRGDRGRGPREAFNGELALLWCLPSAGRYAPVQT